MEKYIITFEGGEHYCSDNITKDDVDSVQTGVISIIRCSDQTELLQNGEWEKLKNWNIL